MYKNNVSAIVKQIKKLKTWPKIEVEWFGKQLLISVDLNRQL